MAYEPIQRKKDVNAIFKSRPKLYIPPLPMKRQRVRARAERHGPVKIYTEEEIFLFKLRKYGHSV